VLDPKALIGYMVDGRYILRRVAGVGTFAAVYGADEAVLGRTLGQVAVKVLWQSDERVRDSLRAEVKAMGELAHEYVVAYRTSGEIPDGLAAGSLYVVMDLAAESLAGRLKSGFLTPAEAAEVALHIGSALAYLASRGAVHSDVKPANILRVGDVWKLGDFGLVRAAGSSGGQGTVRYMAPEAASSASPRCDVWSLGVTLQEALTGVLAYEGANDMQVMARMLRHEPTISTDLPEPLDEIVSGCLYRDPHKRWTAEQVVGAAGNSLRLRAEHPARPTLAATRGEGGPTAERPARPDPKATAQPPATSEPATERDTAPRADSAQDAHWPPEWQRREWQTSREPWAPDAPQRGGRPMRMTPIPTADSSRDAHAPPECQTSRAPSPPDAPQRGGWPMRMTPIPTHEVRAPTLTSPGVPDPVPPAIQDPSTSRREELEKRLRDIVARMPGLPTDALRAQLEALLNDVHGARPAPGSPGGGAVIGGLLGMLLGPVGALIGVVTGAVLGTGPPQDELDAWGKLEEDVRGKLSCLGLKRGDQSVGGDAGRCAGCGVLLSTWLDSRRGVCGACGHRPSGPAA